MNTYAQKPRQGSKKREGFFHRAGWWGTGMLAGALFFLIGGLVSLLNGDNSVALQGLVVCALLVGGCLYIVGKKRRG